MQPPRTTMALKLLSCTLLLAVGTRPSRALRSCTRMGQAIVPCEDNLVLEQRDRFLVTLFGHSCYSLHITSAAALDVYFYDTYSWKKQLTPKARSLRAIAPHGAPITSAWAETMQVCHETVDCHVKEANRSAHTLYDLVIARSTLTKIPASDTSVRLLIESCDAMPTWFYIGLAATALGGFVTMLFLLCLLSEFLLGIHAYSQLRRKLGFRNSFRNQFVELSQFDPLDVADDSEYAQDKSNKFRSVSFTADPSEISGISDDVQRNHADATSRRGAPEA